jgi:glycerol-3-phosphate dehydrogenase
MKSNEFDIAVIGGGITGAGVALDAVSRGLKVVLIEADDIASGTSSRSTKLIHGGLRYLKNGRLGQVAEVGRERHLLYQNALHLLKPEAMRIPVYQSGSMKSWQLNIGLRLYDALAGVSRKEKFKSLDRKSFLAIEPLFQPIGLTGGFSYTEYRSDDARLTLAVLGKAAEMGAQVYTYAEVKEIQRTEGEYVLSIQDFLTQEKQQVKAKIVVNATGPWSDITNQLLGKQTEPVLMHSKGVHLVFDAKALPVSGACYIENKDGRMVFVIPREEVVYVGTTDTSYVGDFQNPLLEPADVDYILAAVNRAFEGKGLGRHDVLSYWVGLRPLVKETGKSSTDVSRKHLCRQEQPGWYTITGGKLTGYRVMAREVMDLVIRQEKMKAGPCITQKLMLKGGGLKSSEELTSYIETISRELSALGEDSNRADYLVFRYGLESTQVLSSLKTIIEEKRFLGPDLLSLAMLHYGIKHEWVRQPLDHLIRRSGDVYFRPKQAQEQVLSLLDYMSVTLTWDELTKKAITERTLSGLKKFFGVIRDPSA